MDTDDFWRIFLTELTKLGRRRLDCVTVPGVFVIFLNHKNLFSDGCSECDVFAFALSECDRVDDVVAFDDGDAFAGSEVV